MTAGGVNNSQYRNEVDTLNTENTVYLFANAKKVHFTKITSILFNSLQDPSSLSLIEEDGDSYDHIPD